MSITSPDPSDTPAAVGAVPPSSPNATEQVLGSGGDSLDEVAEAAAARLRDLMWLATWGRDF